VLSHQYLEHQGIILAAQTNWSLSALIASLDQLLMEVEAETLVGQVRWLNDWSSSN
jgi:hypothetical protein